MKELNTDDLKNVSGGLLDFNVHFDFGKDFLGLGDAASGLGTSVEKAFEYSGNKLIDASKTIVSTVYNAFSKIF